MIQRFLTTQVLLERRLTSNDFTGNTYAAGVMVDARLHSQAEVVRAFNGREITSAAHVSTRAELNPGDRVTDLYGVAREIVTVRRNQDTRGVFSHFVGFLA